MVEWRCWRGCDPGRADVNLLQKRLTEDHGETLASMGRVFGAGAEIDVARELTKRHEEFWRGTGQKVAVKLCTAKEPQGNIH
jgi:hypothetical protein